MSEVDDQVARSAAMLDRVSNTYRRGPTLKRRQQEVARRLTRIAVADAAILFAALVVGLMTPLGMFGALGVMVLLIVVTLFFAVMPVSPPPAPEKLKEAPLKALPSATERWLSAQRPALPAPALNLVDQIGVRLDTLGEQLAGLDESTPAAAEVRKLVGEQLPEFVRGYQRVPAPLRTVERNGKSPDAELVEGLRTIEQELGEMSRELAQGDLDSLATRGRYLEIKYREDSDRALPPPA